MKIQMTVAAIILTTFSAATAASNASTRSMTVAFMVIACCSAGYVENLTLSTMALVWEPDDIGLVAGVMGAIRTAAGAIATSMYSSILSTELSKYLPQYVPGVATAAGLPASSLPALFDGITAGNLTTVPGITPSIMADVGIAVKRAYSMSFRTVFLCTLPFGVILLAAALMAPNVEDYLTDEVARKLHGKGAARAGKVDDVKDVEMREKA